VETKLLGAAIDYLGSSGVGGRQARTLLHVAGKLRDTACISQDTSFADLNTEAEA